MAGNNINIYRVRYRGVESRSSRHVMHCVIDSDTLSRIYTRGRETHYDDVIMGAMAFQITSLTNVYSTVYYGADQRKHQSSASLAFVRGIHHLQNGCFHDVRDASLVCDLSQFLTDWRLVLSMKPWSYIWLEFGLFSTIIYIYIYSNSR